MELYEALGSISQIRAQMARTETFRDFRSLTVGFSGISGIAAATVQWQYIPRPMEQVWNYVDLWSAVAVVNLLIVGAQLTYLWSACGSLLQRRLITDAIQAIAPCQAAGGFVTIIVAMRAREIAWILPGVWAILFSLGVFSCCRLLPRATVCVGLYYMATGGVCLIFGPGPHALSPWLMVGTFGCGQILAAAILYCTLERSHGHEEA
jgi:hypothetical protein